MAPARVRQQFDNAVQGDELLVERRVDDANRCQSRQTVGNIAKDEIDGITRSMISVPSSSSPVNGGIFRRAGVTGVLRQRDVNAHVFKHPQSETSCGGHAPEPASRRDRASDLG